MSVLVLWYGISNRPLLVLGNVCKYEMTHPLHSWPPPLLIGRPRRESPYPL